jgi:serine/threonine protein kinase
MQRAEERLHICRYNQSADIWSFGIVLLELARGRAPLAHCAFTKIILDTVHGPAPCLEPSEHHKFSKVWNGSRVGSTLYGEMPGLNH